MRRAVLIGLAVVTATACGSSGETNGTPVAKWTLEQNLFIGGEAEGPESFADIRGLAVDDLGRVYVLDQQMKEVRLFDSSGVFVRSMGREGEGPGEFTYPNGLMLADSGRIWVYDPRANRVTVLDSTGELVTTHRPQVGSFGWMLLGGRDSAGNFYSRAVMRTDTGMVEFLQRHSFPGGSIDTVPWPDCPAAPRGGSWRFPMGGMKIPFSSGQAIWFDPHGYIWCGDTREVRISRYILGDTIPSRFYSAAVQAAPVTAIERDSAIAYAKNFIAGVGSGDEDFDEIPEVKPVLRSVTSDDSGNVWVSVVTD
ncbi:MAG: 6-bladed beta-propeller, partial [Gemmatimonadales bacterium]